MSKGKFYHGRRRAYSRRTITAITKEQPSICTGSVFHAMAQVRACAIAPAFEYKNIDDELIEHDIRDMFSEMMTDGYARITVADMLDTGGFSFIHDAEAHRIWSDEYRSNNLAHVNAVRRKHYAKNKEEMNAKRRARINSNPIEKKKHAYRQREARKANPAKAKEAVMRWRERNPEKYRAYLDKRNAARRVKTNQLKSLQS